jgi:phage terminase large subunit
MKLIFEISPKIFNDIYVKYSLKNNNRYQIYYGGSSSGKSYFLAQRTILNVLKGRNYLITRNVQVTIRKSVWNEIVKAIRRMNLSDYFRLNKTELYITCVLNNKQILFAGLDDSEKIKSITPCDGVIDDVWVEEATECDYEAIKQLDKRLRGRSQFTKRLTLSFNPILQTHWLFTHYFYKYIDGEQFQEYDNISILKTIYKDNKFLTIDDIAALENEKDSYFYNVYTLGNWGVLGSVIYKNWKIEDLTEIKKTADKFKNGLDFGFAEDPAAILRTHYDKKRKKIYILDELYQRGLTNDLLSKECKRIIGNEFICCDSAEPKSIQELKRYGINAFGAKKGKDSIMHGIQWLQQQEIIIDTNCQNFKNEIQQYKWKEDRDGNAIPQPVDRFNHLLDCLRYAYEDEMNQQEAIIFA